MNLIKKNHEFLNTKLSKRNPFKSAAGILFVLLMVSVFFISGCRKVVVDDDNYWGNGGSEETEKPGNNGSEPENPDNGDNETNPPEVEKAVLKINIIDGTYSRVALPQINFASENYSYVFEAENISSGEKIEVFKNKNYQQVTEESFEIPVDIYNFKLSAFSGEVLVYEGKIENQSLTKENISLSFTMIPQEGGSGSATVKLILPSSGVSSVKAGISSTPGADVLNCDVKAARLVEIENSSSGSEVNFYSENLESAKTQYAIFYLYDEAGALIARVAEDVVIVHGKNSSSTVASDKYSLNSYGISVNLKKDDSVWFNGRNVKLISEDGKLAYELRSTGAGTEENPFAYYGNVSAGKYSVYVKNASGIYCDTKVTLEASAEENEIYNQCDVNFYTVTLACGEGLEVLPECEVPEESDGSYIVLNPTVLNLSFALKEGYNLDNNQNNISDEGDGILIYVSGEEFTVSSINNVFSLEIKSQTEIRIKDANLISYKINYAVEEVGGKNPNWNLKAEEVDLNGNGIADCYEAHNVKNTLQLPDSDSLTCAGKNLNGWAFSYEESLSVEEGVHEITAGEYLEEITLYPVWGNIEYYLSITGTPEKTYYLTGEAFDPAGLTVYYNGTDGTSVEITPDQYTTDFDSISGCKKNLTFIYHEVTTYSTIFVNKATYVTTDTPVLLTDYEGSYSGTEEIPAVYYKFGDWPQTKKVDAISVSQGTASNGFYIGEDGNYYGKSGQYYYKVEPVIWRVLNTKTDSEHSYTQTNKAFFFAESCLEATDVCPFYLTDSYSSTYGASAYRDYAMFNDSAENGKFVWPSNYKYSSIRAWLNGLNASEYHSGKEAYNFENKGFINSAFTSAAKNLILNTTVLNNEQSTGYKTGEGYCCPNTKDKIFLLSVDEITNSEYGFNSNLNTSDGARIRYSTNYTDGRAYTKGGKAHYVLRSPASSDSKNKYFYVIESGNGNNAEKTNKNDKGIIPGMWVKLGEISASLEVNGTLSKTYYAAGEEQDLSGISVVYNSTDGSVNEIPSGSYTTNFESLTGCNQVLKISYAGLEEECESKIHKATYVFTEEPRISSHSSWAFPGSAELPAIFYEFGDYPQSLKNNDISVSGGTAVNGYYIGSDGNYYMASGSNYYKIEPIIWRVLNAKTDSEDSYEKTGKALLFAEHCLDGGTFYASKGSNRTIDGQTVYSTNWEFSRARAFLNGLNGSNYNSTDYTGNGFICIAFSETARARILKSDIANDIASNSSYSNDLGNRPDASYCGNNTQDKIFLLSEYEISNPDYGFKSSGKSDDDARLRYKTDYSRKEKNVNDGFVKYWLRSQYYSGGVISNKGSDARYVNTSGNPNNYTGVDEKSHGIVPAMWIRLNYVDSLTVTGNLLKSYYLTEETEFDPSGLTVTYYDSFGTRTEISSAQFTTNFESISGANGTLRIFYKGLSAELDQKVHKATYHFTENPELLSDYEGTYYGTEEQPAVYYRFGDYPQSVKSSEVSVSSGKASNGYYIGSDGNYYGNANGKFFKVEPIVWRVLNTKNTSENNYQNTGKALFFAENCLEAGIPFYFNESVSGNEPNVRRYQGDEKKYNGNDEFPIYYYGYAAQIYPNNYEYSTIRAWLNSIDGSVYHRSEGSVSAYNYSSTGFLTKAFTQNARARISKEIVRNNKDNSYAWNWDVGPAAETRTCPDTEDKIFLLSIQDITNPDYGFNVKGAENDNSRKRFRSDYTDGRAYAQGGNTHYMLRSPDSDKQKYYYVKETGKLNNTESTGKTDKGIVPAMWVQLGSTYTADESEITTPALWEEIPHHPATGTEKTLSNATELFAVVGEGYNGGVDGPIIIHQGTLYQNDEDTEGTAVYVVTLSGTEMLEGQSTGIWTDLQSGFNGDSDYLTNVSYILTGDGNKYKTTLTEHANIPEGSNLIISGHSLGGMISQQLSAQDLIKEKFNVLNVVTFGSPLLSEGSREGELHRICDRSDIVPLASGSIISSSDAQWNVREVRDGGYGDEIFSTGDLASHLTKAATDGRDVTGPHCFSYAREEVWGDYDVLGRKNGSARLVLDLRTKTFYQNPDL